jgi:hypothetical protein
MVRSLITTLAVASTALSTTVSTLKDYGVRTWPPGEQISALD